MNNKTSRLSKHGSRRLKFVDPTTMERKTFTCECSMWHNNYAVFLQPEHRHWDNLFRRSFRMSYPAFFNPVSECKKSFQLARWNGSNAVYYYNGSTILPTELLAL